MASKEGVHNDVRLVVADVDGTLVTPDKVLAPRAETMKERSAAILAAIGRISISSFSDSEKRAIRRPCSRAPRRSEGGHGGSICVE